MFSRFFTMSTLFLAVIGQVQAQSSPLTAEDVNTVLGQVTQQSADTNVIAQSISTASAFTKAPQFIKSFGGIVTTVSNNIKNMNENPPAAPFTTDAQTEICDSFRQFVVVHQQLLATVIGKHGVLSQVQSTQQVAAILRALEGGVDQIAFMIIDLVPTCAAGAKSDQDSLDDSLANAINVYSS